MRHELLHNVCENDDHLDVQVDRSLYRNLELFCCNVLASHI